MAQIYYNKREIIAKIVYYGPAFSGKTTSLHWLYNKLDPDHVKKMYSLDTDGDRTLFFDLLPVNFGRINGMNFRLKVYTVPGQVRYSSTRKIILSGADAVIFVADSERTCHKGNVESLKNLAKNLAENGLDIKTIPLVLQYNKRDSEDIIPIEIMDQKLNFRKCPSFGSTAIAPDDYGVLEGFISVVTDLVKSFGAKYQLVNADNELGSIAKVLEEELWEQIRPGWDLKV